MHRKLVSVLLTVALVSGFMTLSASPAFAVPPGDTQNFLPDDTPAGAVQGEVLSDKFDGTDRLAHLTNVSTVDTDRVDWLVCPDARFAAGAVVTANAQLTGCREIGSDATGVRPPEGGTGAPPGPPPAGPADEAYEFFWNIPADLDIPTDPNGRSDVVAAACIGAGRNFDPGPNQNCTSDVENDVRLDDADQGLAGEQTSTAEITGFCFEDNNGLVAPNPCRQGGAGAGTNAQVAGRFNAQPHGSNVPNDGFTIRATSSVDVTALGAFTSLGDATIDPGGSFEEVSTFTGNPCVEIATTADSRTWECQFQFTQPNVEMQVALFDAGGGAGFCDPATPAPGGGTTFCKLDAHYAVSVARRVVGAQLTFSDNPAGAGPGAPGAGRGNIDACVNPAGTATNTVDDPEHNVLGCLVDQFGGPTDPATEIVSFEVGAGGQITRCAPGRQTGAPGTLGGTPAGSRCTTTTNAPDPATNSPGGEANATITRREEAGGPGGGPARRPGNVTVTFCFDPNSNGCGDAGAGLSATVTKTFVAGVPQFISIVFAPGNCTVEFGPVPADSKQNRVGEQDNLTVCTFDAFGNPSPTDQPNAGRIRIDISPDFGLQQATRFRQPEAANRPTETTGANATATVGIEAVREGQDTIFATLVSETGGFVDSDNARKSVFAGQCANGIDDDADGRVDLADPGCSNAADPTEAPDPPLAQCQNGTDDDGDGRIDFPNDQGCSSATDNTEAPPDVNQATSRISLNRSGSRFSGRVRSNAPECVPNREVELRRRRRGPDPVVGRDTTNAGGGFQIREPRPRGTFYARVLKEDTAGGAGGTTECGGDKSRDVRARSRRGRR